MLARLSNRLLTLLKKISPAFIICNLVSLFLLISIIISTHKVDSSIDGLFLPPATPPYPTAGLLTHTFEILCSIPPVVCGFSFLILRRIHPNNHNNYFLLGSTILTAGFFLNEIYRIHIILQYFDIPKLATIKAYGLVLLFYLLLFWKQIKATYSGIIATAFFLIILAVLIDSFHNYFPIESSLIEGIPKLFGIINLNLYFCLVCYQTLLNTLQQFNNKKGEHCPPY